MTNLDDPWWPQDHDEIEAFLFIVDEVRTIDGPVSELEARWAQRRDEMRQEEQT